MDVIMTEWQDNEPIYRQIRNRVVQMILEGILEEGSNLPSIRNLSVEWSINPLTVLKGYQLLVQENLVSKNRGRNFFVAGGAAKQIITIERKHFLDFEWPSIKKKMKNLGLEFLIQEHQ
ncbi:MAG: GntR family transcriptional regulator [Francisellaceae bacterium]|nr:GntR family transcriptional regulator [Francisellaceae bacterium]